MTDPVVTNFSCWLLGTILAVSIFAVGLTRLSEASLGLLASFKAVLAVAVTLILAVAVLALAVQ